MRTNIDVLIGQRIRHRRRMLGMTQGQLGAGCGVAFQQIQKYENADSAISLSRFIRVCMSLGVAPADILSGLPPLEPKTETS